MIRIGCHPEETHLITDNAGAKFEQLVSELRPKLHRYCARMTGSAVDGEDIVQDSLIKALAALPHFVVIDNPEGWLFRIAHNTALDFLRRRARGPLLQNDEALDMIAAPDSPDQDDEIAAISLRTFMRLPALQRSAVILKDVLGHSLEETVRSLVRARPPRSQLCNGGASDCARLPRNQRTSRCRCCQTVCARG